MFGYIGRHWRGELSLPQSYWLNGVVLMAPFDLYFRAAEAAVKAQPPHTPLAYIYLFLLPAFFALPFQIWAGVGIWRSAGRRIADGRRGWAWTARIIVLLNLLVLIGGGIGAARLTYSALQAYSFEADAQYGVKSYDDYVAFHGEISEASGDELAAQLANPKIQRLVIDDSIGGFIRPALRAAKVIQDRKLFVVALKECESACTILLAAGAVRAVAPDTPTGFHRGSLAGLSDAAPEDVEADAYYRKAGMSAALVATIRSHAGPDDMYDPSLRELIDDGFITAIYEEETQLYRPAKAWCARQPELCARSGRANWRAEHGQTP